MRALLLAAAVVTVAACASPADDPLEARGRQVYLSQCVQCHAADPAQAGAVGPPVADASRALLEAKVVRGEYPAGYSPKRPTTVMPPMPQLAPEIDALAAYLDRP